VNGSVIAAMRSFRTDYRRPWKNAGQHIGHGAKIMIDIPDIRKRCANSIRNTATGKYLDEALTELQMMRDREETIKAGRCVSSNLLEIAAEQRDPAKWAAMMITKGSNPQMTVDEAQDLIEGTLRHALRLMLDEQRRKCDEERAKLGEAFVQGFGDT